MFDVSWSELLILAIVALIFIGPKDLPVFFNTLGRYAGMIRKQAMEFRMHFEDAMREAELDQLRKEVESVRDEMTGSISDMEKSAEAEISAVKHEVDKVTQGSPLDTGRLEEPDGAPKAIEKQDG